MSSDVGRDMDRVLLSYVPVCLDVSLSSDFIAGFCGETEADHQMTLDLIRRLNYSFVFCFPYSMRQVLFLLLLFYYYLL